MQPHKSKTRCSLLYRTDAVEYYRVVVVNCIDVVVYCCVGAVRTGLAVMAYGNIDWKEEEVGQGDTAHG